MALFAYYPLIGCLFSQFLVKKRTVPFFHFLDYINLTLFLLIVILLPKE
jgi:hypothetical protein